MENQETQPQLLKDYSDLEKGAYLGAMASIASADSEASQQEIDFLTALCQAAELNAESTQAVIGAARDPKNLSVQKCLDVLKASDLKYTFITDIMGFAKADGEVSSEEETNIKQMAKYLGVNQQQFGALKQFVEVADESAEKGEVPAQALGGASGGGLGDMLKNAGIPTNGLMKGVLGVAAPVLIASILGGGGRSRGGMMGGGRPRGGSMLGGGILGGIAGSILSGAMGGGAGMGGRRSGGLGSVLGGLGGMMGGNSRRGGMGGGMGSILGTILGGGRRTSGW